MYKVMVSRSHRLPMDLILTIIHFWIYPSVLAAPLFIKMDSPAKNVIGIQQQGLFAAHAAQRRFVTHARCIRHL